MHSPRFHFCPFHVPFSSPLFPFHFPLIPVMSTSYFLPSFPCTSLHFPFAPQNFLQKTRFFQRFRKEDVNKNIVFPDFRQKETGNPNQQRVEPGTPALRHQLPKDYVSGTSSNYRAVRWGRPQNPTYLTSGGGGGGVKLRGGLSSILS